jgi:predicted nucleic acid-binding protein
MVTAVVDTNVRIGRADADDEHHEVATEIIRGLDHGTLPTGRVTNYVALEALNWISDRKRHAKAVETYDRLKQCRI